MSTRQAVLTALDVLGYERPTQLRGERARLVGPRAARAAEPDLPGARRSDRRGARPARSHPGAVHPDQRRRLRGRLRRACCSNSRSPAWSSRGGLYAQADAPHDHYRQLADRNLPVVLVNAAIEHLGFPCVSCDDAVAVEQAWRPPGLARPRAHRARPRPRRPHAVAAQARGARAAARRRRRCPTSASTGPCSPWRAARPRPPGCSTGASPASSAPATRSRSAPYGPPAVRGSRVPERGLGGRLRRLGVHELHRPAADHRAPADRGDGPRCRRAAGRADRRRAVSPPKSCCSSRSWWCEGPLRKRLATEVRVVVE